jgi:hypothetical protein
MSNTPTIDRLFPARLQWRELYYKMWYHHVPFTHDKYALLEQCRREACDAGQFETVKDGWWSEALAQQKMWDEMQKTNHDAYQAEMARWLNNCIEAEIAHEVSECIVRHRSDKQYDLHACALRALKTYNVEGVPYWLAYIEENKELEQVLRGETRSFSEQIQDIIDDTR